MDIEEAKKIIKEISEVYKSNAVLQVYDDISRDESIENYKAIETVLAELEKKQNMTICGKTPEEAYKILSGIELERQLEIKVTMDNLSVIVEKINKELEKQIQEQFLRTYKQYYEKKASEGNETRKRKS